METEVNWLVYPQVRRWQLASYDFPMGGGETTIRRELPMGFPLLGGGGTEEL